MIPKIIHYCWFGGKEKPQSVLEYIETWEKYLPDFEIKEWNEQNFDVNALPYTREAYFAKKYAFVSDVARLYALFNEGGIYLDTDIKFIKTFPIELLYNKAIFSVENDKFLATSFMASEQHGVMVKKFLDVYNNLHFFRNFKYELCPNTSRFTSILKQDGVDIKNIFLSTVDCVIFPQDFFSAKRYKTGEYLITERTICIHDFSSLWVPRKKTFCDKLKFRLQMLLKILKYNLVYR